MDIYGFIIWYKDSNGNDRERMVYISGSDQQEAEIFLLSLMYIGCNKKERYVGKVKTHQCAEFE